MTTTHDYPLMPLDRLRSFLQFNPYHFWGMQNQSVPVTSQCNTIVPEYGYQMGYGIGRVEMRERIAYAEQKIASYLLYDVAPRHRIETALWPRRLDHLTQRNSYNADGEFMSVMTERGYVRAIGVETHATIQANAPVTLNKTIAPSDSFTLSVATTVTDAEEIAVYFSSADRFDGSGIGPRWRIEPVRVSISGGIATITGPAWLLVKPSLFQSFAFTSVDPSDNSNFAATLDVMRRYTDPDGQTVDDSQATFIWETLPWPGYCVTCVSNPNSADPASIGKAIGRVGIRDATNGIVSAGAAVYVTTSTPPQWMTTPFAACREPDRIEVRYEAGLSLVDGQMDPFWSEIVCMMTLAELPGPICACAEANKRIAYWQQDMARSSGGEQFAYISSGDLSNPLGTRRGHIEAWKRISEAQNVRGIAVG